MAESTMFSPESAVYFNGADTFLYTNSAPQPQSLTIEMLVYPALLTNHSTLLFWGDYASTNQFFFELFTSVGNLEINFNAGGGIENFKIPEVTINPNTWTHIALTVQQNSNTIYINGVNVYSSLIFNNIPGGWISLGALQTTYFGNSALNYFKGYMANVSIWNFCKTQSQIVSDMAVCMDAATIKGIQTSLFSYWYLDKISGGISLDSSGNGNNLEVSGPVTVKKVVPSNTGNNGGSQSENNTTPQVPPDQNISTLSDIARGMQHVVNTTQEVMEQHFLRVLDRYLNADGTPVMQKIQLDSDYYINAPLLALINPSSISLNEMEVEMSVRVDDEYLKKFPKDPDNNNDQLCRTCFMVTLAPMQHTNASDSDSGNTQRPLNVIDIRMKFKAGDKPEGISRIINEFTSRIIPVPVNNASENPTKIISNSNK